MRAVGLFAVLALVVGSWNAQTVSAQDAEDLVGTWESTMETPRGSVTQEYVFTLGDGELAGTVSGRGGLVALEDVRYEDGELTFTVVRQMRGNARSMVVTAQLDGDKLTGTITGGRGGSRDFVATRRGAAPD